jgi:hypothetical protein
MSYVEFRISDNVLRALAPPSIERPDGKRLVFPGRGSRDALCELIDTEVASAAEVGCDASGDRRIELRTRAGHILTIPLSMRMPDDGEWAHLIPADTMGRLRVSDMFVW